MSRRSLGARCCYRYNNVVAPLLFLLLLYPLWSGFFGISRRFRFICYECFVSLRRGLAQVGMLFIHVRVFVGCVFTFEETIFMCMIQVIASFNALCVFAL